MAVDARTARPLRRRWVLLCLTVGTVAFWARLLVVLRGEGLLGIDHYDASIYFGSAIHLIHGHLPYRDFLLLHPPGITVALLPLAALSPVVGDANAWVVTRLAMMGLGALSAVLVATILRRLGDLPALIGGLSYAVSYPAVTTEHSARLEGPASACLLGALALLSVESPRTALRPRAVLLAGLLMGFAATVKIWGVVPLPVVAVYLLVVAGAAHAARFTIGVAVAGTAVCLPFLLAAPEQMWRQVVLDQLDRINSQRTVLERLNDLTGLGLLEDRFGSAVDPVIVVTAIVLGLAALLALRVAQARPAFVVLAALLVMLMYTPTWFPHYAGVAAGPTAILVGAAAFVVHGMLAGRAGWMVPVAAGLAVAVGAAQLSQAEYGQPFPARRMAAAAAPLPGCITADDPTALLVTNVLSRNVRRGCSLLLDLGGYSYDFRPVVVRERDPRWQRLFLAHMSSGSATLKTRFSAQFGLTRASAREVRRWPVIFAADGFELRQPRN